MNCYDAPCTGACPTSIDIPRFIRRSPPAIWPAARARSWKRTRWARAARAFARPTSCARARACTRRQLADPHRPAAAHATDWLIARRPAAVRAGPADREARGDHRRRSGRALGRARSSRHGPRRDIFERDDWPAASTRTASCRSVCRPMSRVWEAEQVRRLGVDFRTGVNVGTDVAAEELLAEFDAVMIAFGMGKVPKLGIPGEDAAGVWDALDFIASRSAMASCRVSAIRVAVIGGGNTAIDAATCFEALGREFGHDVLPARSRRHDGLRIRDRVREERRRGVPLQRAAARGSSRRRPHHRPRTDPHRSGRHRRGRIAGTRVRRYRSTTSIPRDRTSRSSPRCSTRSA